MGLRTDTDTGLQEAMDRLRWEPSMTSTDVRLTMMLKQENQKGQRKAITIYFSVILLLHALQTILSNK